MLDIKVKNLFIKDNFISLILSEEADDFTVHERRSNISQELAFKKGNQINEYIVDLRSLVIDNPEEEPIFDFFVEASEGTKRLFLAKKMQNDIRVNIDIDSDVVLVPYVASSGHLAAFGGKRFNIWSKRLAKKRLKCTLKEFVFIDDSILFDSVNPFEFSQYEFYLYSPKKTIKLQKAEGKLRFNVEELESYEYSFKAVRSRNKGYEELTFFYPRDLNNVNELSRRVDGEKKLGVQAVLNSSNKIIVRQISPQQDYLDYLKSYKILSDAKTINTRVSQQINEIQIQFFDVLKPYQHPKIFLVSKQESIEVEYELHKNVATLDLDRMSFQREADYQLFIASVGGVFDTLEETNFLIHSDIDNGFKQQMGDFSVIFVDNVIKVRREIIKNVSESEYFNEITHVEVRSGNLHFDLTNDLPLESKIVAISRNSIEQVIVPLEKTDYRHYVIPLQKLFHILDVNEAKWDIKVEYFDGISLQHKGLHVVQQFFATKSDKYLKEISADEQIIEKYSTAFRDHVLLPYITNGNYLALSLRNKYFIFKEKYDQSSVVKSINMKSGRLSIIFSTNASEAFKISHVQMRLRSDTVDDIKLLDVTNRNKNNYEVVVDLKNYNLGEFYYELFAELVFLNGDIAFSRLEKASKEIKYRINNSIFRYNFENKKDHSVDYPFITDRNVLYIAHRVRDSDEKFGDKVNEWLAAGINRIFRKHLSKKNIWLVFEKNSSTAQDNGYYFFKWAYENHHELPIYYVIKKNSKDFGKLSDMNDRVLRYMSFKHLLFLAATTLLIAPETRGHVFTWRQQKGRIRKLLNKKKLVFLQHGVTAFKHNDSVLAYTSPSAVTKYIVTSENEQKIIQNGLFYPKKDIWITGFSRWDALTDKSPKSETKKIFVMPTWRGWLDSVSNEKFVETPYYKNYMALLNSQLLNDLLVQNNIVLEFFLHPKFKEYTSDFNSNLSNIKILNFEDTQVNEKLMESAMLITDYSSVAWDEHYMNKPVVFYQFDYHDYMNLTGSYIDIQDNLFGPLAKNIDELIDVIHQQIEQGFVNEPQYAKMRDNNFAYIDSNNSERIFKKIRKDFK